MRLAGSKTRDQFIAAPNKAVRIEEVASLCDVSIMTVSRVFSGKSPVAPATKKRIMAAAAKVGYRPNVFARALKGGRTHSLGVIFAMGRETNLAVARGIVGGAQNKGYAAYISDSFADRKVIKQLLLEYARRRVCGVVLEWPKAEEIDPEIIAALEVLPAAVVVVPKALNNGFDQVVSASKHGVEGVADHFVRTGRRNPMLLTNVSEETYEIDIFRNRLKKHGQSLPEAAVIDLELDKVNNSRSDQCVHILSTRFPDGRVPFDSLFCSSDQAAMGAISWLRSKNLRVPENIAVVGFNNIEASRLFYPSLATVGQASNEVSEAVEKIIFGRMDSKEKNDEPQKAYIPMKFIKRDSAG